MADKNDVQALERISTEVDETQIKITLSSQCIKAQAYLFDKLRKQSERQKEFCIIASNGNLKLEAEIKQAELEINSLIIAHETIKSANVELKKECLLAQEKKREVNERIKEGEKKYENLWLECKNRYESIPIVQKLMQTTNKTHQIKENIIILENETEKLVKEIEAKRESLLNLDRSRIIELATFLVNEDPKIKKEIVEKSEEVIKFEQEIKLILKEQENTAHEYAAKIIIKVKKIDLIRSNSNKRINSITEESEINTSKRIKKDEGSLFYYFNRPLSIKDNITCLGQDNKIDDFSKRKLINILEDIKIDKNDAYNIISKINPEKLKDVNVIGSDIIKDTDNEKVNVEEEHIEELDLTDSIIKKSTESIIVPPTEFLDLTQSTQDEIAKKTVSFDLPISVENEIHIEDEIEVNEVDQTINSQLNTSYTSVESYTKLKDMILKKHNLDSSPQFVYAKNTVLQMRNEDKVITSKFFQQCDMVSDDNQDQKNDTHNVNTIEDQEIAESNEKDHIAPNQCTEVKGDNLITKQESKMEKIDKGVTGFLFSHGTQGIPDSLNVSISTTGYEEGEDFPHCLDSSLLLSPKADIIPVGGNTAEVLSQEVPNFLTGLRKTAFSFFGSPATTSEVKNQPQTSTQNQQNNFSFHFGEEDKKNRSGLFSMFN
ncbi:uncharacterized protein ACR2FA_000676 [Aphomia sociella]